MQQVAEIRSANARVKEARAAYYPALSLTASPSVPSLYGIQSPYPWAHTADLTGGLSFNLQWTVFDGGARKNRLAEARANVHAAEAQANVKRNQIADEVWTAYSNLNTAFRQRQAAVALLESASQSYSAALESYNYGVRNLLDVTAAQRTLAQARSADVLARTQVLTSFAELAFTNRRFDSRQREAPAMNAIRGFCMRCVRARSVAADGLRTGSFIRHSRLVLSCVARLSCGGHCAYDRFASAVEPLR